MKEYSDFEICNSCSELFDWIYVDFGIRPWKKGNYSNEERAFCCSLSILLGSK